MAINKVELAIDYVDDNTKSIIIYNIMKRQGTLDDDIICAAIIFCDIRDYDLSKDENRIKELFGDKVLRLVKEAYDFNDGKTGTVEAKYILSSLLIIELEEVLIKKKRHQIKAHSVYTKYSEKYKRCKENMNPHCFVMEKLKMLMDVIFN